MTQRKRHDSKDMACRRLKELLLAERLDCSTQTVIMMKNDIIQAVNKYLPIDEEKIKIRIPASSQEVEIYIPLSKGTEEREENDKTV